MLSERERAAEGTMWTWFKERAKTKLAPLHVAEVVVGHRLSESTAMRRHLAGERQHARVVE
jgi:hypothetical protein